MLSGVKIVLRTWRQKGAFLWAALIALLAAIYNPAASLPRELHNYVFVVDITQSMNVADMRVGGFPASRLRYARHLLSEMLGKLPCGAKVSLALFANAEVVPLFTPIEVCANYGVMQESLAHLEWRHAWRGSSHLRLGLQAAYSLQLASLEPVQIIFLTDGDEAPPINAITRIELKGLPGKGWLLAGIGSDKPSPIPKFNAANEVIGYWSAYATKIEPSQIVDEESRGKRDDSIASEPREYYLSALRDEYLQELAQDIGAAYLRADSAQSLLSAIQALPAAGHDTGKVLLGRFFAALAALFLLLEFWPARIRG